MDTVQHEAVGSELCMCLVMVTSPGGGPSLWAQALCGQACLLRAEETSSSKLKLHGHSCFLCYSCSSSVGFTISKGNWAAANTNGRGVICCIALE